MHNSETAPVRIGVDGFNLALPHGTGVATYGRSLVAALTAGGHPVDLVYGLHVAEDAPAADRETLFHHRLAEHPAPAPRATIQRTIRRALTSAAPRDLVEVPRRGVVLAPELAPRVPASDRLFTLGALFDLGARVFRKHGRFLTVRMPDPPAVMHWTYPVPVRLEGAANIYTVHDLVPLRLPHTSLEDKSYHLALLRRCLAEAAQILTVSEASRRDIVSILDVPEARVSVAYQPVDVSGAAPLPDGDLGAWLERLFGLERGGYLLFFGAIEPKKNVGRLIEAYLASGVATPLLLVGREAWRAEAELALVAGRERIRRIDHLARHHLLRVVEGARAVIFPSLYEGLGLPVAEAMALGVPVVTSNVGGTAELVGNAAITIDPYDVAALTEAIHAIDSDSALRVTLAAAGRARAERFTSKAFLTELEAAYCAVTR